jgi:hypothetical protein
MSSRFIGSAELSRELAMSEPELHELANRARLPFDSSTLAGMFIHRDALPAWRRAAQGNACVEGEDA